MNYYLGLSSDFRHLLVLSDPSDRSYGHFIMSIGPISLFLEIIFWSKNPGRRHFWHSNLPDTGSHMSQLGFEPLPIIGHYLSKYYFHDFERQLMKPTDVA